MGLYDRDYTRQNYSYQPGNMAGMRLGFPRITPVVKKLLIINVAVFFIGIVIPPLGAFIYEWFQLDPRTAGTAVQLWRLITYQFLHDPRSIFHILFNMLALFFLGPSVERHWGGRKFLCFYLGCGAFAGLFYMFMVSIGAMQAVPMVGASGAILGVLAACAILFPNFVVFLLFFPVPIRVAAIILVVMYLYSVLTGAPNQGGDLAHLAGMAAGAGYVISQPWRAKMKMKMQSQRWEKTRQREQDLQREVDRILEKVNQQGIQSLTRRERKLLQQATEYEQKRNRGR